mmetsp:Transcript_10096/g.21401  ORF Transcript_10096/g.21401 Transcript_10096/m.21401 type:complete len:649 (-) Transcript_10096:1146-3092(-)
MVRFDLRFALCCCNAFLRSSSGDSADSQEEDFYRLLDIERDASEDDIKRAYKKRSLQMHPDKLAQRGQTVTAADQERFTRMKEAYETLSDPHKRETYDAIGEKGLKWLEEPFSIDPEELARNFATSSILDRSKIFAIFVAIAIGIFIQPILICLMADGILGPNASWFAVLTPLWTWDAFILFYHTRVIMMGPIHKPDNIPDEEWVDPLPMKRRYVSLARFLLVIVFEIFVALRLQNVIEWKWAVMFIPIYVWEATTLIKKVPIATMEIVTLEELETVIMGKPFAEFTQEEKEGIAKKYSVVPSHNSPEFAMAYKMKNRAKQDILRLFLRILFLVFVILQLDLGLDWSWWLVFIPVWLASFCVCFGSVRNFVMVQAVAAERDPEYFGGKRAENDNKATADGTGGDIESQANYGAMGDGNTPEEKSEPISPAEREALQAQIAMSGQQVMSSCCSQCFLLVIVCLIVAKLQNPEAYSAFWIIFPLLLIAGLVLCCLGCTIFCVSEIPEYDTADLGVAGYADTQQPPQGSATDPEAGNTEGGGASENMVYIPPAPPSNVLNANSATGAPDASAEPPTIAVNSGGSTANTDGPDTSSEVATAEAEEDAAAAVPPSQPVDQHVNEPPPQFQPTAETKDSKLAYDHQASSIHELD